MAERYFEKFPTITYSNTLIKDLTRRVIFTDNTLKNPYSFYPYDLSHYERPDQFAYRYYGDQYYSWLLYYTNDVVDPYYDWYLPQDEFHEFIVRKYGSLEIAQTKIKYYRTNWATSEPITVSAYNALPATLINYWTPQVGVNGRSISYVRKAEDIIINTNNIRGYSVNNSVSFTIDENVKINFDDNHIGAGQIMATANGTKIISETEYGALTGDNKDFYEPNYDQNGQFDGYIRKKTIYVYHTSGHTLTNAEVIISSSSYLYGKESGTNTVFTTANSFANNFLPEEESYYSPVTFYEYENEKNEEKKTIKVLDEPYAQPVAKLLKDLLE